MNKQRIFNREELEYVFNITTKRIGYGKLQFRRWVGGVSELGNRTMNCIGFNMLFNPELFNPVFLNDKPVEIEGNICICGCSLCSNLYLTNHIESGHQFWVGSSCIEKNRKNLEKKLKELLEKLKNDSNSLTIKQRNTMENLYERLYKSKIEYDKFHRWELDKLRPKCLDCYDYLYTKNRKDIIKNINDYGDNYCFKCEEKRNAPNCVCCNKKIFCNDVYNEDNTKKHLYKLDYCDDCGNNYKLHTFSSNIDFSNVIYKDVIKKNKIVPITDDDGNLKWGVRGYLLKLPSNIRDNILGDKNYDSQEEDPYYEKCEFYKYDINDLDQE